MCSSVASSAYHPSLSLSLLSHNGRHLWHFVHQPFGTDYPYALRCTDLLSNRFVLYPLIGFSSVGQPLAIYWAVSENNGKKGEDKTEEGEGGTQRMVFLDFKAQTQSEGGAFVSQRLIQLDHTRRWALWVGPTHRQHGTAIARILRVVLGSVRCAIVGEQGTEDGASAISLLCIPRFPDSFDWPSEVSLNGFSTSLIANSLNSLFFLGRPIANGTDVEPCGQTEKLFFAAQHPRSGQFVAVPVCPLSASLPFRLLPIRASVTAQPFPPSFTGGSVRLLSRCDGHFVLALFRLERIGAVRWSLGRLDTSDLSWHGPLVEWEDAAGDVQNESPEAILSTDGGIIAMAKTTTAADQQKDGTKLIKELRCLPLPFRFSVPSLCEIILLSLQCLPSICPIRQSSCQLATHLKLIN